jgi:hypothetical protein
MNFEKALQNFVHENVSNKTKFDKIFEMGQKFILEPEKEEGFLNFLTDYSKSDKTEQSRISKYQYIYPANFLN